jgi:hypothetical protein
VILYTKVGIIYVTLADDRGRPLSILFEVSIFFCTRQSRSYTFNPSDLRVPARPKRRPVLSASSRIDTISERATRCSHADEGSRIDADFLPAALGASARKPGAAIGKFSNVRRSAMTTICCLNAEPARSGSGRVEFRRGDASACTSGGSCHGIQLRRKRKRERDAGTM